MADDATPIRPTDYGLVCGGAKTVLRGRVNNINRLSDVASVPDVAGAGLAVGGGGARAIVLTNQKGAMLELSGRQVGADGQCVPERAADCVEVGGRTVVGCTNKFGYVD